MDKAIKRLFDYLFICDLTSFFRRFYAYPKLKSFNEGLLYSINYMVKNTLLFVIDGKPMIGFQYVKKEGGI